MCLYVAIGLVAPRLALALVWLFRNEWLDPVRPWWLALLGVLFLPFTLLAYTLIYAAAGQVDGLAHMVILLVALFLDVGAWSKGRRKRTKRSARVCKT